MTGKVLILLKSECLTINPEKHVNGWQDTNVAQWKKNWAAEVSEYEFEYDANH